MNVKKALLAGAALVAMVGAPAQASIVDNPHFRVLGLVIVWSGDASGNPVANDFVIGTGAGGTDLIGSNGQTVVTGTLTQTATSIAGANSFNVTDAPGVTDNGDGTFSDGVLDASAAFGAFTLDDGTGIDIQGNAVESSFFVASNTPFNLVADADMVTDPATTDFSLADVGFSLSHTNNDPAQTNFGSQAFADVGDNEAGFDVLDDFATSSTIFTGDSRTASGRGTIMQQSVRFDAVYTLGGTQGYDLSMGAGDIEANVTYTVFVP
ncbi:MAG: hypothetical protein AAFO57_07530 [Pseudomonadota bacterium]